MGSGGAIGVGHVPRTRALFRRMGALLAGARTRPTPERVHQLRVTARRLQALIEAADPDRRARKLLKRLARLRRLAGKVRDVDVQIAALRTLKIGREDRRKARLMHWLGEAHEAQVERLRRRLSERRVRAMRGRLQEVMDRLLTAGIATAATAGEDALGPVDPALRLFARAVRRHGTLTRDNIHEYRAEGKRARYVAEMAGADPDAARIVRLLTRQQDSVGEWHDWATLTRTAEKVFDHPPGSALLSALRNVTDARFAEACRTCREVRRELMALRRVVRTLSRDKRIAHA